MTSEWDGKRGHDDDFDDEGMPLLPRHSTVSNPARMFFVIFASNSTLPSLRGTKKYGLSGVAAPAVLDVQPRAARCFFRHVALDLGSL
jgi:hypothetical protein